MSANLPEEQVAFLTQRARRLISLILSQENIEANISTEVLTSVTTFFLRDIYRIDEQQRGDISLAKFAGYWGFWIRKLKPISDAKDKEEDQNGVYHDINELVAIQFAVDIIVLLRAANPFNDNVWQTCDDDDKLKCNGVQCFKEYTLNYFGFHTNFFQNYITYSMRNRTFGPHHFSLMMESLMYSACVRSQFGSDLRKKLYV